MLYQNIFYCQDLDIFILLVYNHDGITINWLKVHAGISILIFK